ncbi:hypothetical protein PC116_g6468 [Phytophthora cactorum]|uniref:Uncharacterized protein n=1 Tax=Phytophthora cactorum TaxID=29920 RepID=A0A8T1DVT6_9STRA|nr:hypothetical protein PC114_g8352 [Phytophthora cactorum]KAG2945720.1 hypothetical protein PC117_g8212 [Phytophthora cactorum]KAG3024868.1 hypothetical protein PC120_g6804 [Phytophthora cactorum]KAG3026979.1 hypothetical protein PC119_g7576 [Phytophthora cactorum]KAG3177109.1 hypothetical protein C6341_g8641 [Phytophthora cactorum]
MMGAASSLRFEVVKYLHENFNQQVTNAVLVAAVRTWHVPYDWQSICITMVVNLARLKPSF